MTVVGPQLQIADVRTTSDTTFFVGNKCGLLPSIGHNVQATLLIVAPHLPTSIVGHNCLPTIEVLDPTCAGGYQCG
jgi:hypothetical protein